MFNRIHRRFDYVMRFFPFFFFRLLDEEKRTCDLNFETSFRLTGLFVISPTSSVRKIAREPIFFTKQIFTLGYVDQVGQLVFNSSF